MVAVELSCHRCATAQQRRKKLRAAVLAVSPPPTRPGSLDGGGNESGSRLPPRKDGTSLFLMPPWLQQVLPQCTHAQWAGEEAQCRLLQAARGGMLPGRRCGERAGWLDPDARTEVAQHFANAHNLEVREVPSGAKHVQVFVHFASAQQRQSLQNMRVPSDQGTGGPKEPPEPGL